MSVKISGKVWELDLEPTDKLVLLALADHADHEGENVRPGNARLCAKTGLSERTISTKLASFIERGILQPVETQAGRGHIREYNLNLDDLSRHRYFIEYDANKQRGKLPAATLKKVEAASMLSDAKVEPDATFQAAKVETASTLKTQKVEAGARKVETDDTAHDKERARLNRHEPSEEEEEEAASPAFAPDPDPVFEMAEAIARVMGLSAVPEGKHAEPIFAAADEFVAANIPPSAVGEFETDFYRRKNGRGQQITLTLKILCEDLAGWFRARSFQVGNGGLARMPEWQRQLLGVG